ncbi:hypothetical protein HYY69_01855 [Candidatus Woesearchaeota archaeon]|nr:hypothetical protein [Candidatus Woesearchaeota archaeon]
MPLLTEIIISITITLMILIVIFGLLTINSSERKVFINDLKLFFRCKKKFGTVYSDNKETISNLKGFIYFVAEIVTIFSIIFAIVTYYQDRERELDKEEIIIEQLKFEINFNLIVVKQIEDNTNQWKNDLTLFEHRFRYSFLEKSSEILQTRELREDSIKILDTLIQANALMDKYYKERILLIDKENLSPWKESFNLTLDEIYIGSQEAKQRLLIFQKKLEMIN